MTHEEAVDRYFLEHRAKVLDIAAFLDRLDRCDSIQTDYRIDAFRKCLEVLLEANDSRAEKILDLLSDHSKKPLEAATEQGASGAPESS